MRGPPAFALLLASCFVAWETEADSDDEQGLGGRASPMQWSAPDPVMDQVLQTIPLDRRLYQNDMASSEVFDNDPEVEEIMRRLNIDGDPPTDHMDISEEPPPDELETACRLPVGPPRARALASIQQRIEERVENAGGSPWEPNGQPAAPARDWNPFSQFSRPPQAGSTQASSSRYGTTHLGIAGTLNSHHSQYPNTDPRVRGHHGNTAPTGLQQLFGGLGFTMGSTGTGGTRPRGPTSRTVGLRRKPQKWGGRNRSSRAAPDSHDHGRGQTTVRRHPKHGSKVTQRKDDQQHLATNGAADLSEQQFRSHQTTSRERVRAVRGLATRVLDSHNAQLYRTETAGDQISRTLQGSYRRCPPRVLRMRDLS